ncbi:MAG: transglycosylase SLT domain-containing protein, partial [Bacteroidota bacterium]
MKLRIMEDARKEIQEDVDKLTRSPTYFNKQVEKAKSYFPIIERVFNEENLPDDFKFLVLQESGLISDAVSASNAVGFWQFKDFTAMEVGLRVDRQVDERMNIVAASRGAARYMKKNNNSFFDNWLMSLQAYQMGPGTALKVGADKHRGEKSMTINKKTYWYVKKYLAHKIAYEEAVKGTPQIKLIEHKAVPNESLNDIAALYRVDSEEVGRYNKWLRKGRIPDDKEYTVIIPTENAALVALSSETVAEKLATTGTLNYDLADPAEFPAIKDETLAAQGELVEINGLPGILARAGDKIPAVAALGNLELSKFLKYNDLAIDDQLIAGQVYYLKSKRSKARARYHIAAEEENLWDISQKYGVKKKKLRIKNRMKADEVLKPGRVVWLRYIRPAKVPIEYKDIVEPEPVKKAPIPAQADSSSTKNAAAVAISAV